MRRGVVCPRLLEFQAQQSCALAGKDLCTNEQWQAAAAGTFDPGSSTADGPCLTGAGGPRASGLAGSTPGGVDSCMSSYGAEDMVGNLHEWVADWYVTGQGWMTTDNEQVTPWPAGYGDDQTGSLNGHAFDGTDEIQGLPAAAGRGGGWASGTVSGVFTIDLHDSPAAWSVGFGFRCCRGR